MTKRTIYDVDEDRIEFISKFLVDYCKQLDPTITIENLKGRMTAIEMQPEQYYYFLDGKYPLMHVDLKLLMDGV